MAQKRKILKEGDKFERYTIVRKLGEGGMGAVYQVYHAALDSTFALKILSPEAAEKDSEFVDRFVREARLSSHLRHPNLIAVHDAGRDIQNGMYYLVMDYVDGGSVRDKLDKEGRLTPEKSIAVVLQVLSALTEARKNKMVHRDIKPDNIMFTSTGVVKLADLGIAKATNDSEVTLTMEATIFGTPAYMSPQQAHDAKNVDCRADIYSLGIVFYEMLTGQCPYRGAPMAIIAQVVGKDEVRDIRAVNPAIPDEIANIVKKMCAKNLEDRYQTPEEVLADLEKLLDPDTPLESFFAKIETRDRLSTTVKHADSIVTSRESWERQWHSRKKRKKALIVTGIILFLLLLVYDIFWLLERRAEQRYMEELMTESKIRNEASAAKRDAEQRARKLGELLGHKDIMTDYQKIRRDEAAGIQFSQDNKKLLSVPADYPHSEYVIPDGITSVASGALRSCEKLKSLTVPGSCFIIDSYNFSYQKKLRKVMLADGVLTLGSSAFYSCTELEEIHLPESLKQIEDRAFAFCGKLKKIVIPADAVLVDMGGFCRMP